MAREAGLGETCRNPFRSIIVRSVELVYACDEALRLIDAYEQPDAPAIEVNPRAGSGHGASEAPRGLLYHRYRVDAAGTILEAQIVPPTSQNQQAIEDDLRDVVASATWTWMTSACAGCASRRSATTIPASPARPISCGLR